MSSGFEPFFLLWDDVMYMTDIELHPQLVLLQATHESVLVLPPVDWMLHCSS